MTTWDAAIADLHSCDGRRYVAACRSLDRLAERTNLPQLYDLLLRGRDFLIREQAAIPVARLDGVAALPQLLKACRLNAAEGHDNDSLDNTICGLLAADAAGAAPILAEMIRSASAEERADAASLWGWLVGVAPPGPLIKAAKDRSAEVRRSAVQSLASYKCDRRALRAVEKCLSDTDEQVRGFAELASYELADSQS